MTPTPATSDHTGQRRPIGRATLRMLIWMVVAIIAVLIGIQAYQWIDSSAIDYDVVIMPSSIPADGSSSALLEIRLISRFGNRLSRAVLSSAPRLRVIEGASLVRIVPNNTDSLRYRIIPGHEQGTVVIHVLIPGAPGPIEAKLHLTASLADRNRNGYPDQLDLTSQSDRSAFRRWFTTIALGQLRHTDDAWNDRDCAGLARYCYREALKKHDRDWLALRHWMVTGAIPDVRKYNYPNVPIVGTRIFNAGRRQEDGYNNGGSIPVGALSVSRGRDGLALPEFYEFAEAARLKDNSLVFISRRAGDALPGDLIFYLNDTSPHWPYHVMIYLGNGITVYHTGPDGSKPGILKRMSLQDLASHNNPRWHPVEDNQYFLGYYRWRILA